MRAVLAQASAHEGGVHWSFHEDSVDRALPSQIVEVDIITITSGGDEF